MPSVFFVLALESRRVYSYFVITFEVKFAFSCNKSDQIAALLQCNLEECVTLLVNFLPK